MQDLILLGDMGTGYSHYEESSDGLIIHKAVITKEGEWINAANYEKVSITKKLMRDVANNYNKKQREAYKQTQLGNITKTTLDRIKQTAIKLGYSFSDIDCVPGAPIFIEHIEHAKNIQGRLLGLVDVEPDPRDPSKHIMLSKILINDQDAIRRFKNGDWKSFSISIEGGSQIREVSIVSIPAAEGSDVLQFSSKLDDNIDFSKLDKLKTQIVQLENEKYIKLKQKKIDNLALDVIKSGRITPKYMHELKEHLGQFSSDKDLDLVLSIVKLQPQAVHYNRSMVMNMPQNMQFNSISQNNEGKLNMSTDMSLTQIREANGRDGATDASAKPQIIIQKPDTIASDVVNIKLNKVKELINDGKHAEAVTFIESMTAPEPALDDIKLSSKNIDTEIKAINVKIEEIESALKQGVSEISKQIESIKLSSTSEKSLQDKIKEENELKLAEYKKFLEHSSK